MAVNSTSGAGKVRRGYDDLIDVLTLFKSISNDSIIIVKLLLIKGNSFSGFRKKLFVIAVCNRCPIVEVNKMTRRGMLLGAPIANKGSFRESS